MKPVLALGLVLAATGTAPLPTFIYTNAKRHDPAAWMQGKDRYPQGAQLRTDRGLLVKGFFATADPAVSYDAKRVLFAGKRTANDSWAIYELDLSAGQPKRLTSNPGNCFRPRYLPAGKFVYTRGADIEVMPLAGGAPERLTFGGGRYLVADVLRDGRILFETVRDYGRGPVRELFTVYPDGTHVESLRCDHGSDRYDARQDASGDVIFRTGAGFGRFTSALATQTHAEVPPRFDAVPLQNRTPPKRFPSARVPTRANGNLLCLNVYQSKHSIAAGSVRSVRAYTKDDEGDPLLLGETSVESDGSFFIELPSDRPLRLELRDRNGRTVMAERGWFWMRPSEQRVCVGCHNGPERSPENAAPKVLSRDDVPVKMLYEKVASQ